MSNPLETLMFYCVTECLNDVFIHSVVYLTVGLYYYKQ